MRRGTRASWAPTRRVRSIASTRIAAKSSTRKSRSRPRGWAQAYLPTLTISASADFARPVIAEVRTRGSVNAPATTLDARLIDAARALVPPLLFGLRLWASVCLALYVAFWLELDNAYWAANTAAIVCQPHLGASLRKGWFRMIGTVIGAVAIVVMTACFPQDRALFLVSLALWGAGCALVATGGLNGQAFMLAVDRASEICIGIVCAGVVLAGTDLGGSRRRLGTLLARLSAEIARRFTGTLIIAGAKFEDTQAIRRELLRRVMALDPVIDEALGESSQLRYHSTVLQNAVDGLFATIASWRIAAVLLARSSEERARREADAVLAEVPESLHASPEHEATRWIADP